MTLEISSTLLARLLNEAETSAHREVCGLLLGTHDRITDALACRNVAPNPRTAFEIDPAQLIAAHRAEREGGRSVIGCYHSHPGGPALPSARDAAAAPPDGSIWIILAGRGTGCYRAVETGTIDGRFDAIRLTVVEG